MEKNGSPGSLPPLPDRNAIKDIFGRMSAEFVDINEVINPLRDAEYGYTKALSLESRSIDYYQSLLTQIGNARKKPQSTRSLQKKNSMSISSKSSSHSSIVPGMGGKRGIQSS